MRKWSRTLHSNNQSLRARLKKFERYSKNLEQIQSKVIKTTFSFIKLQVEQQSKKSRGRRFSMEDKIFALSVMKQAPKGLVLKHILDVYFFYCFIINRRILFAGIVICSGLLHCLQGKL